jgi:hypothetical protein
MKRIWIPLAHLDMWDWMHKPDGDGFVVDAAQDGQTTEEHRAGIDYIKSVLREGQKIRPILAADNEDGTFKRLDGFKRAWAHQELGEKYIEAFVCTADEYRRQAVIPYGDSEIRCYHGGLPKEQFGLFEGGERENFHYDDVQFLYKSENPAGLRIELAECIHVHWGEYGRYRLALGRRDFDALTEALAQL